MKPPLLLRSVLTPLQVWPDKSLLLLSITKHSLLLLAVFMRFASPYVMSLCNPAKTSARWGLLEGAMQKATGSVAIA